MSDTSKEPRSTEGPPAPSDAVTLWRKIEEHAQLDGVPLATILTVAVVAAALYLTGKLLYTVRDVVFLFLTAALVAVIVDPLVVLLEKRVHKRGVAVFVVTGWTLVVAVGLVILFGYPLLNSLTHTAERLPQYLTNVQQGHGWIGRLVRKYHIAAWYRQELPHIESFAKNLAGPAIRVGKGAVTLVITLGLEFGLVMLLLLEAPHMRTTILNALPTAKAEHARSLGSKISSSLSGFLFGDLITSVIAGGVVLVTLLVLGVPYPFLWATWVALVDFLPQIGGAVAGIPTILFAFTRSLLAGVVTLVVFFAYTQLENHILNPLIMSRTVKLSPLLIFCAVLVGADFGALVGGPFGGFVAALLAIPIAGSLQIVVRDTWRTLTTAPVSRRKTT
jgi:predicted PurR-regulated permease PerM